MYTRRDALAAGMAAAGVLGLAGCLGRDSEDPGPSPEPGPEDLPPEYIDVREYGAAGDGETDDSGAIKDAIEAADPGETVFLPETSASYLLSFDESKTYGDDAIRLDADSGLDDVTVLGDTAAEGAQTLQVESGSYDETTSNTILNIEASDVIEGFTLRNLTIDGARPDGDGPASHGGEGAVSGITLAAEGAGGGHNIVLEDIVIQNCSASALRFEESGVTCRRVTSRGHGRHGFNPVLYDTTVDPGFVGESIKAVDCDGTGINHRRGTAKLSDVYTENNRSGNKWKHHVKRLEVENHHSVNDQNHGWRSNQTGDGNENSPSEQEIIFNDVFVENPVKTGIRVSGSDTDIVCDFDNVEVRNAELESPEDGAGVRVLRDVELINPGSGELVVVGTRNGVGVRVYKAVLSINTYQHNDNDLGYLASSGNGAFSFQRREKTDPGRNVFQTPEKDEVGAFTKQSLKA